MSQKPWTALVPSHQLPDQCQGMQPTPLIQVFSSNADQREASNIPAQLNSIVAVLQLGYTKSKNNQKTLNFTIKCFVSLSLILMRVHSQHAPSSYFRPAKDKAGC